MTALEIWCLMNIIFVFQVGKMNLCVIGGDLSYGTTIIYPFIVAIQEQNLHPSSTSGPPRLCCHISQV